MSFGTLQGISTILAMLAFIGVVWWAYGSKRKARFDEAALLPFVDDQAFADKKPLTDNAAKPASTEHTTRSSQL